MASPALNSFAFSEKELKVLDWLMDFVNTHLVRFVFSVVLAALVLLVGFNKDSDWHTMRIHGQMYFSVEPPFVRSISWFPPRAPAACGCTLI